MQLSLSVITAHKTHNQVVMFAFIALMTMLLQAA